MLVELDKSNLKMFGAYFTLKLEDQHNYQNSLCPAHVFNLYGEVILGL
jgi:hypothetical protein